jgi:hypothetical protein
MSTKEIPFDFWACLDIKTEDTMMAKPSKSDLSKAGSTLASPSSTPSQKSNAGSTLGKG